MTYTIKHANGLNPIVVSDNTFDNSTSVYLIGKNYVNYGELFDQNFLWIMEHWASNVSPANPTVGQIWYDLGGNGVPPLLKVYTPKKLWKSIVTVYSAAVAPLQPDIGDLWMNISDPAQVGLYIYTADGWLLVGPYVGVGQVVSEVIYDKAGRPHNVLSSKILNKRYTILSPDQTFEPRDYIPGFSHIDPGLNLISTTGLTNVRFTGRATDSDKLEGLVASQFMRTDVDTGTVGTLTVNNDTGLIVGTSNHFRLGALNNNMQFISQFTNGDMRHYVTRPALYGDPGIYDAFDIYGNGNVSINSGLTVVGISNLAGGLAGGSPNRLMKFGANGAQVTYTSFALSDTEAVKILNASGAIFTGKIPSAFQIKGSTTTTDWSSMDFSANGMSFPMARIGASVDATGSYLALGTGALVDGVLTGINNQAILISPDGSVQIANKGKGGPLYGGALSLYNTANLVPTPKKFFRVSSTGALELVNSAYSATIFTIADNGDTTAGNDLRANGNLITPVSRLIVTGGNTDDFLVASNGSGGMKFRTVSFDCVPKWCTPRKITLGGDASGNVYIDGSTDVTLVTNVDKLHTKRFIAMTGDVDWAVQFDGSSNVSSPGTLANLHVAGTYYKTIANDKGLVIGGNKVNPINGTVPYMPYFNTTETITASGALWNVAGGMEVTGYISATGDIIAYETSDATLKTNIEPITEALDKVSKITGVTYDWTDAAKQMNPHREQREAGVLAQDVQAVLPEIVTEREDGHLALKYDRLTALLIQAVKELTARVEELEKGR